MAKRAATAAFVVALLALTGCGRGQPVSSPPSALSDAPPYELSGLDILPGRISDAIPKVDDLAGDLMKSIGIPGMAVAVLRGGKTVYAKGFGVKDASKGDSQDDANKLGTFTR